MKTHTLPSKAKAKPEAPSKFPHSGGHTRENDIRWTKEEWDDMARLGAAKIAKMPSLPLGEVLHTVQKSALPSRRWKPLDELSAPSAQTKFYAACKRSGYVIAQRPPRREGLPAISEAIRWTEREMLLVLRRFLHLREKQPTTSSTELFSQCQDIELPPERRYPHRHSLSTHATFWNQKWEPLKNNLWLLDSVPFITEATTYEQANGLAPLVVKNPEPTPTPTPTAAASPEPVQAPPALPPEIPPAALLSAPILPPSGAALDGLATGIAGALNAYIAQRDAAITAHVMQSIASGPLATALAAHIVHSLAPTITEAVNAVVSQVVPRIVAAELLASVQHITTATGPIQSPQPLKPEAEPPPVIEAKPEPVQPVNVLPVETVEVVQQRGAKPPKHNPEPIPDPQHVKKLRVDLVGTERGAVVGSVMKHLNGAGRYVDLHGISQDMSQYRPAKGTPVVVFNGFSGHDIQKRAIAAGAEVHLCGKGTLAAAITIKKILTERGYLRA